MRYASDAFGYLLDFHLDYRILEIQTLLVYLGLQSAHGIGFFVNNHLFLELIQVELQLLLRFGVNLLQLLQLVVESCLLEQILDHIAMFLE